MQEQFRELLKTEIAPLLRRHGLKGSGQNYSLPSGTHWALIGFQKSVGSNAGQIRFTINLFVVSQSLWAEERKQRSYLPVKPTANVHWHIGWNIRIGVLLPEGKDHWWSLDRTTNRTGLVQEVVDAITAKALPAMHKQMEKKV